MRCFYLSEPNLIAGAAIRLPNDLKKHLQTVLRLQPGDEFQLFNGNGRVARAILRENAEAEISIVEDYPPASCSVRLIQGIPKGDKLELILQKGTEIGVDQFYLTAMDRSVGRLKSDRKQKRLERWQKIVQEAARQCRQYHLPQLSVGDSLAEVLPEVDADLKLLLWEESAEPLAAVLPQSRPRRIAVVVGPEGGVSAHEARLARDAGYQPVSIGPRILRTETAGLAIMAILQYLYGDLACGRKD